uniref:Uncharacterized protein n=1 Tax=Mesocestoides corti TaxID=53468 RepID=A0A5K3FSB6_MESCO
MPRINAGTSEQDLLINHKPETHFRHRPSDSITLATLLIIYCSSFMSVFIWLYMPLERKKTQDWLRPGDPTCLRPIPSPLAMRQAPSIRVHRAGHAAHYILLLSRVLLWLAAHLPRMPLDHRGRSG